MNLKNRFLQITVAVFVTFALWMFLYFLLEIENVIVLYAYVGLTMYRYTEQTFVEHTSKYHITFLSLIVAFGWSLFALENRFDLGLWKYFAFVIAYALTFMSIVSLFPEESQTFLGLQKNKSNKKRKK